MIEGLYETATQQSFGAAVGVGQPVVSRLLSRGVLAPGGTLGEWIGQYTAHLRAQAEERLGAGPLDLAAERAALAREQRQTYALRNGALQAQYAPRALLEDVLKLARDSVAAGLIELPAALRSQCAGLPMAGQRVVDAALAEALAEWLRQTGRLDATPPVGVEGEDDTRRDRRFRG